MFDFYVTRISHILFVFIIPSFLIQNFWYRNKWRFCCFFFSGGYERYIFIFIPSCSPFYLSLLLPISRRIGPALSVNSLMRSSRTFTGAQRDTTSDGYMDSDVRTCTGWSLTRPPCLLFYNRPNSIANPPYFSSAFTSFPLFFSTLYTINLRIYMWHSTWNDRRNLYTKNRLSPTSRDCKYCHYIETRKSA